MAKVANLVSKRNGGVPDGLLPRPASLEAAADRARSLQGKRQQLQTLHAEGEIQIRGLELELADLRAAEQLSLAEDVMGEAEGRQSQPPPNLATVQLKRSTLEGKLREITTRQAMRRSALEDVRRMIRTAEAELDKEVDAYRASIVEGPLAELRAEAGKILERYTILSLAVGTPWRFSHPRAVPELFSTTVTALDEKGLEKRAQLEAFANGEIEA